MIRKYGDSCCAGTEGGHCAFCSINLCAAHERDVEVEGHIFQACEHCAEKLAINRPGKNEHCVCHYQTYCDIHDNIGPL